MSAVTGSCSSMRSLADLQSGFLGILPRIELHAGIYFRHVRCQDTRAERIAETLGLAWKWYRRLSEKGFIRGKRTSRLKRSGHAVPI
jgi:hypothetical protein